MPDSCGADILANELLPTLVGDKDFSFNDSVTGKLPANLKIEDLTTRQVGGDGVFDAVMESVHTHLKKEYEANRITGSEYTKAYIELTSAALSTATQFLLGKDQAYWQSILIRRQAMTAEAEYALMKMKLATEDATYCNLLLDKEVKQYTLVNMLPAQKKLLDEQVEVQRSQTLDNRTDGALITGSVGKQKALYDQQITSYKRDAEVKAAKLFTDAWITQKTLDEGLVAPNGFTNASVDLVLTAIKTNNAIG